jgi:FixJ family two-component response regulator
MLGMEKSCSRSTKPETRREPLISVVDDDDLIRRSTRRLLRSFGFRSDTFASAEDFLQSGRAGDTACLLLDVKMPGMGGVELQRRLAETGPLIPIVFVSARASENEERRALQAGATAFLRKPVSKEALLLAIREALKTPPNDKRKMP